MNTKLFTWHTQSKALCDFTQGLNLALDSGSQSLLILTCYENNYPQVQLTNALCNCSAVVFGGIYPMITFQNTLLKTGALIIGFNEKLDVTVFSQLQEITKTSDLEDLITSTLTTKNNFYGQNSFLMFYDALLNNIERFIDTLFECLDHHITIAGGGAGNLDFAQQPCIFSNKGVHTNAVLLVTLSSKMTTGVAHGWRIFKGPLLVSDAEEQTLKSLNYQPALDVYRQAIESYSNSVFNNDNFFDIAKNFPLGIEDINNNLIVRDPIFAQQEFIQCAGEVPINSLVYLLESDANTLISSAEKAAITAFSTTQKINSVSMIFDCISRVLYLEEGFNKELDIIVKHCNTKTLFGALSLGEIANSPSGSIRLLNKSTVISSW
jgi:hypothetical protein